MSASYAHCGNIHPWPDHIKKKYTFKRKECGNGVKGELEVKYCFEKSKIPSVLHGANAIAFLFRCHGQAKYNSACNLETLTLVQSFMNHNCTELYTPVRVFFNPFSLTLLLSFQMHTFLFNWKKRACLPNYSFAWSIDIMSDSSLTTLFQIMKLNI